MSETMRKWTIAGIGGHPMSGLWTLQFEDGSSAHIESGYGVRALASCFGATEGTGDLLMKIRGKEIYYSVDAFGVLEAFTPVDEATPELIAEYEKGACGQTLVADFGKGDNHGH